MMVMAMNRFFIITVLTLLSACSLAPDFVQPKMDVPQAYDEQNDNEKGKWKVAKTMEAADRGDWWKIFNDKILDGLEKQALEENQSIKIAAERLEQSRATVRSSEADFFPTVGTGANYLRTKPSSVSAVAFGAPAGTQIKPYTAYSVSGDVSYEADLFGRVRDTYRTALLHSKADEATYKSMLLALQGDVAQNYFNLRTIDEQRRITGRQVKILEEAARIMKSRTDEGDVGERDNSRAKNELAIAKAQELALDNQRAQSEHALAVLLGKMPERFKLAEAPFNILPPSIPAGLPSTLLERRPDVVSAQNSMMAANYNIGVARSAFFPSLDLTASGGLQSSTLSDLFKWSSRSWALGPLAGSALSIPIFAGGRDWANLDQAKSGYKESVASYRQQVLVAFQEVEDSLAAQHYLAEQYEQQNIAAKSSKRAADLTKLSYDEGDVNYFEVVNAERDSLVQQQSEAQLKGQRLNATVKLIRALGGGWRKEDFSGKSSESGSEKISADDTDI